MSAEIYFIVGMMVMTFVISSVAMYAFVRTYKREMRDRALEKSRKASVDRGAEGTAPAGKTEGSVP